MDTEENDKDQWAENKSNMESLNMIDKLRQIIKMMETRNITFFWTRYETPYVYCKYYRGKNKWEKRKRTAEGNKSG